MTEPTEKKSAKKSTAAKTAKPAAATDATTPKASSAKASSTKSAAAKTAESKPAEAKPARKRAPAKPKTVTTDAPVAIATTASSDSPAPEQNGAEESTPDVSELIRVRAYLLSRERGGVPGYELEDWLRAEQEFAPRASRQQLSGD
jgi:hypothetical protein